MFISHVIRVIHNNLHVIEWIVSVSCTSAADISFVANGFRHFGTMDCTRSIQRIGDSLGVLLQGQRNDLVQALARNCEIGPAGEILRPGMKCRPSM